jgi:hypothetical protein
MIIYQSTQQYGQSPKDQKVSCNTEFEKTKKMIANDLGIEEGQVEFLFFMFFAIFLVGYCNWFISIIIVLIVFSLNINQTCISRKVFSILIDVFVTIYVISIFTNCNYTLAIIAFMGLYVMYMEMINEKTTRGRK